MFALAARRMKEEKAPRLHWEGQSSAACHKRTASMPYNTRMLAAPGCTWTRATPSSSSTNGSVPSSFLHEHKVFWVWLLDGRVLVYMSCMVWSVYCWTVVDRIGFPEIDFWVWLQLNTKSVSETKRSCASLCVSVKAARPKYVACVGIRCSLVWSSIGGWGFPEEACLFF